MADKIQLEVTVNDALNLVGALTFSQAARGAVVPELSSLSQNITSQLLSQTSESEVKNL